MKLSECREGYYAHSGSASSVSRQAAFAGIAFVWIFHSKDGEAILLPTDLLWPVLFLILGLCSDLLQYVMAAAVWGCFHRTKEKQLGSESELDIQAPMYLNWPSLALFWLKHLFVVLGYLGLLSYVGSAIKFG